jgi:uncharacterized membrane protein
MTKFLIILLIGLIFEAVGVVCLSKGLKQIGEVQKINWTEVSRIIRRGAANSYIGMGIFFEALFFVSLLVLMSKADVSFVWPLTSLSFVLTAVAAKIFLHEHVSPARWTGVVLIMCGAALITWTEKMKEKETKAPDLIQTAPPQ